MQKAKKYDFKDSNLALFGSPLERKVKEAAANTEQAWHGSGLHGRWGYVDQVCMVDMEM